MADEGQKERSQPTDGPGMVGRGGMVESSRWCTGWERKAVSTAKQRECQGLPVLAAATFSFWSVLWGLPARLSALAEPVRRTTLESHRSFPAPCLLGSLPNHHPSQSGIRLHLSSARSKPSERVLYGPQNIMLLVRTLNYIYI
jgi:hypothetical protein